MDFVSLKREWALHDSLSKSINLILNLSVHTLNVVILLGKNSCELWLKRAAKYKTVLVDNQLTLFTTAKISSNWHYPIRLTQMVYALWLQNFLQGLLMCDRFWFLHIFSYSNPIKSQLKTVLIGYCLHERIWVNFGCGNDDIGNSAISCRWQWIIILILDGSFFCCQC